MGTISSLPAASTIDATQDYLPIDTASVATTQKINRNTFLGLSSQPLGLTDTQSPTNKTFNNTNSYTIKDGSLTLQNTASTTKQAVFSLSGITAGQTRTITLPDFNATMASLAGTETFTNKTLTSPTINSPTITNATISTDAITGYTSANNGTLFGISISSSKIPGTNISNSSITTSQIASGTITASNINFGGSGSGIWWQEIARTTLGALAASISVTGITAKKYLKVVIYATATGGTINLAYRFNSDSGNNYAWRTSANGGADSSTTATAQAYVTASTLATPFYNTMEIINVLAQEKLAYGFTNEDNVAGAGTAINRVVAGFKWANTAAQITRIDIIQTGTGNFASGSEVIVLGHD